LEKGNTTQQPPQYVYERWKTRYLQLRNPEKPLPPKAEGNPNSGDNFCDSVYFTI
jgi:hypothetical protein